MLRDGEHIITKPKNEMSTNEIIKYMVGRSIDYKQNNKLNDINESEQKNVLLEVKNLNRLGVFKDISFDLKSGEIIGITGLVGAGRTEIAEAIFGITSETSGRVLVYGEEVQNRTPKMMLQKGVAYLPEDRDNKGCIVDMTILENVNLSIMDRLAKYGIRNIAEEKNIGEGFREKLQIKASTMEAPVKSLSGGNRHKVVLSKWLATNPKVMILDEPTHGIDVAVKEQVHQIIRDMANEGIGIVVISSDLPEVLSISDRILVIAEGELVADFDIHEATQEIIMEAAILRKLKKMEFSEADEHIKNN